MVQNPADVVAPQPLEDASPADKDEALMAEIMRRLEASKTALFGVLQPEAAITHLDAALAVADQLEDENVRSLFRSLVEMQREYALGFLLQGQGGDLKAARAHFERAKELGTDFAAAPEAAKDDSFRGFQLGIELAIVQTLIPEAQDDDARNRLTNRHTELMEEMMRHSDPKFAAFGESLGQFGRAMAAFRESVGALVELDLERASFAIDKANRVMDEMEKGLAEAVQGEEMLDHLTALMRGFEPLLEAQQAYVAVLHAAIVGDVRERHVAMLETADEQLLDGLERVKRAAPFLERMIGQLTGEFPIAEFEESIERLRTLFGNLRQLVKEGVSPKEVTRRSAPRLVVYFAISLVVMLAGVRLSGIVSELGGTELVSIVLIALVVATGSSFGWEALIRLVGAIPWPFGGSPDKAPSGQSEAT